MCLEPHERGKVGGDWDRGLGRGLEAKVMSLEFRYDERLLKEFKQRVIVPIRIRFDYEYLSLKNNDFNNKFILNVLKYCKILKIRGSIPL